MMDRREFCKYLALLAAGVNSTPEQSQAYERLYDVNTRALQGRIIKVHEVEFGFGGTPADVQHVVRFMDGGKVHKTLAMNQRASMRWIALPDCPLLATEAGFHLKHSPEHGYGPPARLIGTLSYINMEGVICHKPIDLLPSPPVTLPTKA